MLSNEHKMQMRKFTENLPYRDNRKGFILIAEHAQ